MLGCLLFQGYVVDEKAVSTQHQPLMDRYIAASDFEQLHLVATEKAVKEFKLGFEDFVYPPALYSLCSDEFVASISAVKEIFNRKRRDRLVRCFVPPLRVTLQSRGVNGPHFEASTRPEPDIYF